MLNHNIPSSVRRGRSLSGSSHVALEPLESRTVLAIIAWDGGVTGNGTSLTDPLNWAGDILPTAADDVIISPTGTSPLITLGSGSTFSARSITLSRVLDNRGTLTTTESSIIDAAGSMILTGGSINGGTITTTNVITIAAAGSAVLGATISGEINISSTLSSLVVGGATSITTIRMSGSRTNLRFHPDTVLSNSAIILDGASGARSISMHGTSGTVTWTNGVTLSSTATFGGNNDATLGHGAGDMTLVNNGLISFATAGKLLTITAHSFTNNGTVHSVAGTLAISATSWVNNGTILVGASSSFNLGTGNTARIGSIQNTAGGTVNVTGPLTNTGLTLTLNATSGSWNLAGGTIFGGTVNLTEGASLRAANSTSRISGATINGEVTINANGTLIVEGATSIDTIRLNNSGANLRFVPGTVLSDSAIILDGIAGGSRTIGMRDSLGTITWTSTVTLSSTEILGGTNNILGGSPGMILINNGQISLASPGRTLTINAFSFTNNGLLRSDAGSIGIIAPSWTNSGVIAVASGSTLNLGGNFTTAGLGVLQGAAGGAVNITGTLTNTGQTLILNEATGSISLLGGTIVGGTVNNSGGATILATTAGGTINGATVHGEVSLATSGSVVALAGTVSITLVSMSGVNTNLRFAADAVFSAGTIRFEGVATGTRIISMNGFAGTVTLGPGAVVQTSAGIGSTNISIGPGAGGMTLINYGSICSNVPGRPISVSPTNGFTNAGIIEVQPGALVAVTGNYGQTSTGLYVGRFNGLANENLGRMTVTGTASLDGAFSAIQSEGFELPCFASVDFISASALVGQFATLHLPVPNPRVVQTMITYINGTTVRVSIRHTADYNNDATLNADDLADFINDFFAGNLGSTDFNGDGETNADDLADYINAFFTPC